MNCLKLNLQLFADGGEGGDGGTGAEGTSGVSVGVPSQQANGSSDSLENVKYGIQDDNTQNVADSTNVVDEKTNRKAEFEKLIKTDYKEFYDERVKDTIQKRLKGTQETIDKYNKLTPMVEMLSKKYGVDANDLDALNSAIEEDDSYYEDEALEKGLTVEQLKSIKKMERENSELKRQMQEQSQKENAEKILAGWLDESEALKSIYPSFDFDTEIQNPQFGNLLRNGIDVRTAFEVIHKDEIIPAAMQYTAKQVEQKVTNKIRANGSRPTENGINSQSSAVVKNDVSILTKEDRAEINRRVARGEKIRF